jgi:bis(5'-nucleosidyl)-tetraphosphatase
MKSAARRKGDTERRVRQAGGIVVRTDAAGLSVLLVRAKRDPTIWIFPKGHIERGETAEDAALRETREEAGIVGDLVKPIGRPVNFHNGRYEVSVQYYLIRSVKEFDDNDGRAKQWFSFDAAVEAVHFEENRELLRIVAAAG